LTGITFSNKVDSTMWYITFIMIYYVAFYLIFRFIKNDVFKVITFLVFASISYVTWYGFYNNGEATGNYPLQFIVGVIIAMLVHRGISISKRSLNITFIVSILLFIISIFIQKYYLNDVRYLIMLPMILIHLFSFMYMVLFVSKYLTSSKVLKFIGGLSYELYLLEAIFLMKYKFIFNSINNRVLAFVVYFILICILALGLKKLLKYINFIE
ncbi:acyltransferase family protein, partial [Clostridium sp.]|uniref:acyltransferase family protein n=1 Tax=Clostridium sp. TaxID=1506 RepID=UPI003F2FEB79